MHLILLLVQWQNSSQSIIGDTSCDILIIDECSTISNSDILKVLNIADFKLLILVGDIYQIESIIFGNWFYLAREIIDSNSIHELKTPWRSKNSPQLQELWDKGKKH